MNDKDLCRIEGLLTLGATELFQDGVAIAKKSIEHSGDTNGIAFKVAAASVPKNWVADILKKIKQKENSSGGRCHTCSREIDADTADMLMKLDPSALLCSKCRRVSHFNAR